MNILHVVHAYPPSIGGSQHLIRSISERLVTQHGDTVTVFTTVADQLDYLSRGTGQPLPANTTVVNGVTVRRFPAITRGSFLREAAAAFAYRLRLPGNDWLRTIHNGPIIPSMTRAIAQSGADVVFATAFPLLHMYYALWGAQQAGIPIVFLGALHLADTWNFDRPNIYHAIQQADAYIAHTAAERDEVIGRGARAEKVHVIGGGVDAAQYAQGDGVKTRQVNGWGNDPIVLLLGKQVPRKRHDLLLAAMPHLWQHYPDAWVVMAGGSTPYGAQIQQMVAALPSQQQAHVVIRTDIDETAKVGLLAACDLLVLPSSEDSFGIVLVEAWACDKPVVAARTPVMASLVDEGRDGLLFTPGDALALAQSIRTLLTTATGRQQMGNAGRVKVAENFTWDVVTKQVRGVYQRSISV